MSKEWIVKQTDIVSKNETINKLGGDNGQLTMKKTILEQKRIRLDTGIDIQLREIHKLKQSLRNLQNDMNRLND